MHAALSWILQLEGSPALAAIDPWQFLPSTLSSRYGCCFNCNVETFRKVKSLLRMHAVQLIIALDFVRSQVNVELGLQDRVTRSQLHISSKVIVSSLCRLAQQDLRTTNRHANCTRTSWLHSMSGPCVVKTLLLVAIMCNAMLAMLVFVTQVAFVLMPFDW